MKNISVFNELIKLALASDLNCAIVNTDSEFFNDHRLKTDRAKNSKAAESFPFNIIDLIGINNSCRLEIENNLKFSNSSSSLCGATILYENYCAAIIGNASHYETVGIDFGELNCKASSIWRLFKSEIEMCQAKKYRIPYHLFEKIIFSIKDAAYQCVSSSFPKYKIPLSWYQLKIIETSSEHRIKFTIPKLELRGSTVLYQGYILSFVYLRTTYN